MAWPADERAADPAQEAQRRDLRELILRGFDSTERLLIILYYFEELTMREIGATLKECPGGSCDEQALKRLHQATASIRRTHGSRLDVSDLLNAIEYAANNLYGHKELGPFGAEKLRMHCLSDYLRLTNFLAARGILAN